MTKAHMETNRDDSCRSLKEAIQSDLVAWGVFGSFIASIAFQSMMHNIAEPQAKIGDSTAQNLTFMDFILSSHPTSVLASSLGVREGHVLAYAKFLYTMIFMYAGVSALKGVFCGTLKYLLFASAPPPMVVHTICTYLEKDMRSTKGRRAIVSLFSIPSYWDHYHPIMQAAIAVSVGSSLGITFEHGFFVGVPCWFLTVFLGHALVWMQAEAWNASLFNVSPESWGSGWKTHSTAAVQSSTRRRR